MVFFELGPPWRRIAALSVAWLGCVTSGCSAASSECDVDADCSPDEVCVAFDGVLVSGGKCAPKRLLDAREPPEETRDGHTADAANDANLDTYEPADTDTSPPIDADTSEPVDADTFAPVDADTSDTRDIVDCPGTLTDLGDAVACTCDYRDRPTGVCADQPLAADAGCPVPDAYESDEISCDGKDNDCDGEVDEELTRECGKATGACTLGTETCTDGTWGMCSGQQPVEEDCQDGDDNDCDGAIDEGCACDYDGNASGVCGEATTADGGACAEPAAFQTIESICGGGDDNDCDGLTDCGDDDCEGAECNGTGTICESIDSACHETACEDGMDNDGDGQTDCQDADDCPSCPSGTVCSSSGACVESLCGDVVDNDGDGQTDCADDDCVGVECNGTGTACRSGDTTCHETICGDGTDNDGDGQTDCADDDCDGVECSGTGTTCRAGDAACHETNCDDGDDNDGDGEADCGDGDCTGDSCTRDNGSSGVCCANRDACRPTQNAC